MSDRRKRWTIGRNFSDIAFLQEKIANAMRRVEGLETTILDAVQMIESYGCSTVFQCQREDAARTGGSILKVLSMDLVCLRPGLYGSWSEDGWQACYCIKSGSDAQESHTSWYQRALNRFFSTHNCRSLLTYPDIYTRPIFLEIRWLVDDTRPYSAEESRLTDNYFGSNEIWESSFSPDPNTDQSVEEWGQRFDHFITLLRKELDVEYGQDFASDAILAWIYVSAGTSKPDDNMPPPWASSMFLLFKFEEQYSNTDYASPLIERDLDLLLSNLSYALQAASQRVLPGSAKHDIAQALAHEFKNLNQDIAVLSERVQGDIVNVSQKVRLAELDTLRGRLHALHLAAQASTAFSTAGYWLASPTWNDIELRPDDERCSIFTNVVYLAIRLIAETRRNWKLIDIPEIELIVAFLDEHLNLNTRGSLTRLISNRCISIMMFFALEPIRNMRSDCAKHPEVEVRVEAVSRKVVLIQRTTEIGRNQTQPRSETIMALMQIVRDNPRLAHFIWIDPEVSCDFADTPEPNVFFVHRRTTIYVDQVPYPKY